MISVPPPPCVGVEAPSGAWLAALGGALAHGLPLEMRVAQLCACVLDAPPWRWPRPILVQRIGGLPASRSVVWPGFLTVLTWRQAAAAQAVLMGVRSGGFDGSRHAPSSSNGSGSCRMLHALVFVHTYATARCCHVSAYSVLEVLCLSIAFSVWCHRSAPQRKLARALAARRLKARSPCTHSLCGAAQSLPARSICAHSVTDVIALGNALSIVRKYFSKAFLLPNILLCFLSPCRNLPKAFKTSFTSLRN